MTRRHTDSPILKRTTQCARGSKSHVRRTRVSTLRPAADVTTHIRSAVVSTGMLSGHQILNKLENPLNKIVPRNNGQARPLVCPSAGALAPLRRQEQSSREEVPQRWRLLARKTNKRNAGVRGVCKVTLGDCGSLLCSRDGYAHALNE